MCNFPMNITKIAYCIIFCIVIGLCPALISPRNGDVSVDSYYPGGTATYTCNSGYELSDESPLRTCSSLGIWSGSNITCESECLHACTVKLMLVKLCEYLKSALHAM